MKIEAIQILKTSSKLLFALLAITMPCSANDNIQNVNQTNQALANLDNQLATFEFLKAQVNQQYQACLASI